MKKLMLILVMMAAAAPLYAAQGELATFGIALGAGLAISLAALGGGIGQGIAMRGALEGIARKKTGLVGARRSKTELGAKHRKTLQRCPHGPKKKRWSASASARTRPTTTRRSSPRRRPPVS